MSGPLWVPDDERVASSAMTSLRLAVNERLGLELADSLALHAWSVADPGAFWRELWDWGGVLGDRGDVALLPAGPGEHPVTGVRWFPEARISFTENLLHGRGAAPDAVAVVFEGEAIEGVEGLGDGAGPTRTLTWGELRVEVGAAAAALRDAGVGPGDRVAAWMPNTPETLVLMAATLSLGAVFSSTSPDFGVNGVLDRFAQIEPTVLVAADGYRYGGQSFDCLGRLAEITAALPTLRATVVVPFVDAEPAGVPPGARLWADVLAPHRGTPVPTERFPFDQAGFILYSSGTTGKPKCIVHRAGGLVLKHLTEHRLHGDVRPGDREFYFTTCGWMMWNWLMSGLAAGATLVLYDGNPFHPGPEALFSLAERHQVNLLGVSAKFIDSCRKAGIRPGESHDLSAVRTICSTGSPLGVEGFEWVYDAVGTDLHLASISGGTDLCGCFVAGDPTRPVWPGEIQGPGLAMDVDVYDDLGAPVGPGVKGELVCRTPFPSVPLGFLGDDDGRRFTSAYFSRFPDVWAQGDFASWTEHGGMVIHGRSDATLNAGGVRIGTAELYRVVENFAEVTEAIAVGQEWDDDTRIVLFVRLADGHALDDDLVAEIRRRVRTDCSPRHVPARIVAVEDIPRTRSGKLVELAVTDVVNGREVRNLEAIANPDALSSFAGRPELAS
ncbi:MAG: acetoacetate--CoA ligase [Acidimicrobiales bacterium]|nr:acetoacetate--CoA ligase [Acidimicrobiales bacterium]